MKTDKFSSTLMHSGMQIYWHEKDANNIIMKYIPIDVIASYDFFLLKPNCQIEEQNWRHLDQFKRAFKTWKRITLKLYIW